MVGSRRIKSRALTACFLFSIIFLFYFIRSSHILLRMIPDHDATPGTSMPRSLTNNVEVDLIVVEEHHEVMEYWFDAAKKGIIPQTGNILLHVDAHSDMAPPEMNDSYPLFRRPINQRELKAMMQSNDMFIQAAAMTGLFQKIIWVWPSWDEDGVEYFCACVYEGRDVSLCKFTNRTMFDAHGNYNGSKIDPKLCKVKVEIDVVEIADYLALNKLIDGTLIREGESVLLDIDEDYFGVVLRGHTLLDVGISWSTVDEIDEILSEMFCPDVIAHEGVSNHFMQLLLSLLIKHCKSNETDSMECAIPDTPQNKQFSAAVSRIIKRYLGKDIFCGAEGNDFQKRFELLIELFLSLNVQQLRTCAEMGFCMQTSPRSLSVNGFSLCHGANPPNSTLVTQHTPSKNELILRLKRLRRMLHKGRYPNPGMVTVCRSVRDGYTYVKYFEDIEKSLIKIIKSSRNDVNFKVIYDVNLLGGKGGWSKRHKTQTRFQV
ncbi:uncharacterized protein LOC124441085 isoform X2 [Xenia sp. Carnegie-2017]|uniref:uncharacterized protein LOC124441085 isoform X2 n=1 Tax=Xenia sp. Carnegie-2017 TaxID=2897299 RepID=UPI001F04D0A8|nr:uncharacterized protein LOC124441085 isoform X2 [Xenia sp. Carnegie-2017]